MNSSNAARIENGGQVELQERPSQLLRDDENTLIGSHQETQPRKDLAPPVEKSPHDAMEESSTSTTREADKDPADGPPRLPYNLREHKLMISIFWFLIFTECTLIPIIFYFTIANLTDMRRGAMFAIITAMFGFISGGEYGLRGLRLLLKNDEYRPLNGAGRWGCDSTHLVLGPPYFVMTALMIGFSIPDPPIMRGLSMIMPVGIIMVGVFMIWTGVGHHLGWRLPFRLSSHPKGAPVPPLTFCIMEDICGCDGGGGKRYRQAALDRYEASPRFRRMLVRLLWWWSTTAVALGVVLTVIIWIPQVNQEVAYALGWAVPSLWGAAGAYLTIRYCQRSVRTEKEMWVEERNARLATG